MTGHPMTGHPITSHPTAGQAIPSVAAPFLGVPIEGYRHLVSPFLGQRCRFYPSCSSYAVSAIQTHGAVRGLWLAARRWGGSNPWTGGAADRAPTATRAGAIRCHTS